MSWYKDQWNNRYMEAYDEAIDEGLSHEEAEHYAELHAQGLWEDLCDGADMLRKARKENS